MTAKSLPWLSITPQEIYIHSASSSLTEAIDCPMLLILWRIYILVLSLTEFHPASSSPVMSGARSIYLGKKGKDKISFLVGYMQPPMLILFPLQPCIRLQPIGSLTGARTLSLRAAPQVGLDSINCSGINTPSHGPSFYSRSRVDWA